MKCWLVFICSFSILSAEETVYLKSGKFQKGRLISQDEDALAFEFKKSGVSGTSRVKIPWRSIERIEFPASLAQIDALSNPEKTELKVFEALWEDNSEWLSRPNSQAADIGLVYARKLLTIKEPESTEQALALFDQISKQAWQPADQVDAIRSRLNALLALGRERDAIREAEALAEESEDPILLLEAKQVLASNAFEKLKTIESENPRWQLDDDVRPIRNLHFNTAIDHSLFAYLFYGSEEQPAAQGLMNAVEIYTFAKDVKNSKLCAEDIVKLYPNTDVAKDAKTLLSKLSKKQKK